ncbi:MAG: YqaA family protein [Bryobacteraceae bacterium]
MSTPPSTAVVRGWRVHRRLYDWVLHWADTPHGVIALFLLAFAESSFFPIPPDVLLIALVLGSLRRWVLFAAVCTAGSVLGGIAGYGIGYFLMDTVGARLIELYHAQTHYQKVAQWYQLYDFWIVFGAAFTPIPYKVFTIASGAFQIHIAGFVLASLVGRGARFFLVAGLLRAFGEPVRRFIDKYFDWLALAFVVLLAAGFALIRYAR